MTKSFEMWHKIQIGPERPKIRFNLDDFQSDILLGLRNVIDEAMSQMECQKFDKRPFKKS